MEILCVKWESLKSCGKFQKFYTPLTIGFPPVGVNDERREVDFLLQFERLFEV